MAKEVAIVNYHTSGTTAPLSDNIELGEIAVGHDNDSPRMYIKKNNGEIAQFVDKTYVDKSGVKTVNGIFPDNNGDVKIPEGTVVAKLSVDLEKNASNYSPYPYNMTDDDVIQNGFIVVPEELNLDEWYSAENKAVVLDIKEDAKSLILGENLSEVGNVIPCSTFRMDDTSAGPTYIFSYDFDFSYIRVAGFISIDQWDYDVSGETKYSYSFALTPYSNDPIEILAIEQEDGNYECEVTQSSGYCKTYIENGGRNVLLTTRPVLGTDSSPLLMRCEASCVIDGDMALLVGVVPNIGNGYKESIIMVTKAGTAGYVQREAALKSDLDLKQNVLTAGNNIQISGDTISTINGGVILLDIDNIINNSAYWDGDFDETITSGTTSGETEFFEFIGESSASTITADEYFEKLIDSCVYVSTKMDGDVNFKLEVNNMYNEGNGLLNLVLHSHILGQELEALDVVILLNFTEKVAYVQTKQWMSDEMTAAKPVLVEVNFSTEENASGETINSFTLKRNGEKILPSKIFELETNGYSIQYFSYTDSNERRIMPLYRAEGSNISSRINLFYVDTDSYHSSDYTPSLTFMNFTSAGTITYNKTKGVYTGGIVEQVKFPRGVLNSDNYLSVNQTLANKYEVNANVVDIDDVVEGETIALADVLDVKHHIDLKQDTLVSGENIKTINNKTLLGAGNINTEVPIVMKGTSDTTITIEPNKMYVWDIIPELTLDLAQPEDTSFLNVYMMQFSSSYSQATSVSWPVGVKWATTNVTRAGYRYQVVIVNNIAMLNHSDLPNTAQGIAVFNLNDLGTTISSNTNDRQFPVVKSNGELVSFDLISGGGSWSVDSCTESFVVDGETVNTSLRMNMRANGSSTKLAIAYHLEGSCKITVAAGAGSNDRQITIHNTTAGQTLANVCHMEVANTIYVDSYEYNGDPIDIRFYCSKTCYLYYIKIDYNI